MKKWLSIVFVVFVFFGCNEKKDKDVSIYMWGGSKEVNTYFDTFVIPEVKKAYGLTLHRVPVDDIKIILQKIDAELKVNKKSSTDIIWINGENFKLAKQKGLLFGPFTNKLSNYNSYIDEKNLSNLFDFGEATDGFEAPFGRAQFVMVYNSEKVKNPPTSYKELFKWIKENPGRFTYPALPDFTASALIRNLFIDSISGVKNFDENSYESKLSTFFTELNSLKPYMFQKGKFQPNSSALLDTLYEKKSVDFTFSYNPSHALNKIKNANFPKSSKTAVFSAGTLSNTHFLAIPKNATNPNGAMDVINFLLSPKAQLEKAKSSVWGDGTVLDVSILDEKLQDSFEQLSNHPSLLSTKELNLKQIPELKAEFIEVIEKQWIRDVQKK